MNNIHEEIFDEIAELTGEILYLFEFSSKPSGLETGDDDIIGFTSYELTPYSFETSEQNQELNLSQERYAKLREVYALFNKNFYFMFSAWSRDGTTTYYSSEDVEIDCHRDSLCLKSLFELGRCWGEYLTLFGSIDADYWDREISQIDTLPAPQFVAEARDLKRKQALFPAAGTRRRVLAGKQSKRAAQTFFERNFPNGLDGRTKKHIHEECHKAVSEWVELKRRLLERETLTEAQLKRERSLRYLSPLTKSRGPTLKPYTIAGIRNIFQSLI